MVVNVKHISGLSHRHQSGLLLVTTSVLLLHARICTCTAATPGGTVAVTRLQIMNNCDHCYPSGPVCLRMDLEDRTNAELAQCNRNVDEISQLEAGSEFEICPEVPFASIVRLPLSSSNDSNGNVSVSVSRSRFKVRLVGASNGVASWVGIAFGKNETAIMRKGSLGIACVLSPGRTREVRVIHIQDRIQGEYTEDTLRPIQFAKKSLQANGVHNPVVLLDSAGYLLCEFELDPILQLDDESVYDLENEDVKIGLAHNRDQATVGITPHQQMLAHGARGSSWKKLDLLRVLQPVSSDSDGDIHVKSLSLDANEESNSGDGHRYRHDLGLPVIMMFTLTLLAYSAARVLVSCL